MFNEYKIYINKMKVASLNKANKIKHTKKPKPFL